MSEPLKSNGNPLRISGVTLRTPGLAGRAEVRAAGAGAGVRGPGIDDDPLSQALADADMSTTHVVEIEGAREVRGGASVTRGTPTTNQPAIELEVPAPGPAFGQVVLAVDEAGVVSWNFPVDAGNKLDTTRGGSTLTYVIRRAVPPAVGAGEARGLTSIFGKKVLKVIAFPLIDKVAGAVGDFFAARWEEKNRPYGIRTFTPDDYAVRTGSPVDWTQLTAGRALLMVHGTFSRASGAFNDMPRAYVEELHRAYDGRVFAFDHFTVSVDPIENVRWFVKQLPADAKLELDIICHSRGGLVSRVFAERQADLDLGQRTIDVKHVVFAASPNAGTVLADAEHFGDLIDSFTNLLNFFPDNQVTDTLNMIIAVVKQVAVGAYNGLTGIDSMDPDGDFLKKLNKGDAVATRYSALAANFEPSDPTLKQYAKDVLLDALFAQENDMVVPTAGVWSANGAGNFPIDDADKLVFDASFHVNHSTYFKHEEALRKMADWLGLESVTAAMANGGPGPDAPKSGPPASTRSRVTARAKPPMRMETAVFGAEMRDLSSVLADQPEIAPVFAEPGTLAAPISLESTDISQPTADPAPAMRSGPPRMRSSPPPPEAPAGDDAPAPRSGPPAASATRVPTAAAVADPPRSSFGLVRCPAGVVAGDEFDLEVGLAAVQEPGTEGGPLVRPDSSQGAYTLDIQVVADGFKIRRGTPWRFSLKVTAAKPYPTKTIKLTAAPQEEGTKDRAIVVYYSVDGHTMGFVKRPVTTAQTRELLAATPAPPPPPTPAATSIALPSSLEVADVTVRINTIDTDDGRRLKWTFDAAPALGVKIPAAPANKEIDSSTDKFARKVIDAADSREGTSALWGTLAGAATRISDKIPAVLWTLLGAAMPVAAAAGRKPTLLIITDEPYIPWELAMVPRGADRSAAPPFDPDLPPFLGAQVAVGRWILNESEPPKPTLPPTPSKKVTSMAVISGDYSGRMTHLEGAVEEAAALAKSYAAVGVDAAFNAVDACLDGDPQADILHFAVHGLFDSDSVDEGFILTDGQYYTPDEVRAKIFGWGPFVFLNACQVGSSSQVLGAYAGMAEAFLYAGASGLIAPLWQINDSTAKEFALGFYKEAMGLAGTRPAELVRAQRALFVEGSTSGTPLAYQFYGHPAMVLSKAT